MGVRSNTGGEALLSEVEIFAGGQSTDREQLTGLQAPGIKVLTRQTYLGSVPSTLQFSRLPLRTTRDKRVRVTRVEGAGIWIPSYLIATLYRDPRAVATRACHALWI